MRLALVKCFALWLAVLTLAAPPVNAGESLLTVVYGDASVREADRGYSRAMARNLSRWLEGAGFSAATHPDSEAQKALARPVLVAHLLNIENPSAEFLKEVDAFIKRGGRLIVYNSFSQALADRLEIKLTGYAKAETFGQWSGFRFVAPVPPEAPAEVRQISLALRAAVPASARTSVAAWWEDARGQRTKSAAWLAHPRGYWMTQVLLEDQDGDSRRRLVTALSGKLAPEVWREAADGLFARLGTSLGARDYAAACKLLQGRCPAARKAEFDALRGELDACYEEIVQARQRQTYELATTRLWHLQAMLSEAHALTQTAWSNSLRGVWDHEGYGFFPGDWEATAATLARYGISDVFLLVATADTTHATVPGLTPTMLRRDHGDQLAQASRAARRHGLKLHAWIAAFSTHGVSAARRAELAREGRLLLDQSGQPLNWLDPAQAANRTRLRETARYLATNYDIDGIHLDYIRYADFPSSLGSNVRTAFEKASGRPVANWPLDVQPGKGARAAEFVKYRADMVTEIVGDLRQTLRRVAPEARFSASVYGRYPLCVDSVGQDWMLWLRRDLIDYAAPMNYVSDLGRFRAFLADQAVAPGLRRRILPGIGVTAAESHLGADAVMQQLDAARAMDFGGYVLFDLDGTLRLEVLPFLRLGLNRAASAAPTGNR